MIKSKEFDPEQSSNVSRIAYLEKADGTPSTMCIQFRNGGIYNYAAVPVETWLDAVNAESIGKFVGKEIRGKFESVKEAPDATD
jgi:hypothetical protein